jgi:hypothetical protein
MRPSLLSAIPQLLFTPLIRSTTPSTISRTCASIPIRLSYPSCRRLTSSSSLRNSQTIQNVQMSSTSAEMGSSLNKMAEPAAAEAGSSKPAETKKEEKKAEPELPKLSAADFKIYNSMSENMDHFVHSPPPLPFSSPPNLHLIQHANSNTTRSTTTSAKPGTSSTRPAKPVVARPIYP